VAEVIPGEGREEYTATARLLLEIAGPGREGEIVSGTLPARFTVPEDVAEEYLRRTSPPRDVVAPDATPARSTSTRRGPK
jgi:hypothetical protein